jgi:hypothetical protein
MEFAHCGSATVHGGWVSRRRAKAAMATARAANKKPHPGHGFTNTVALFESFLQNVGKNATFLRRAAFRVWLLVVLRTTQPAASLWAGPPCEWLRRLRIAHRPPSFKSSLIKFFAAFFLVWLCCLPAPWAAAGEAEPEAGSKLLGGENQDEEKEEPFKFSAWCAFRDISSDYREPKKNSLPLETRPISTKWMGFGRRGHWIPIVLEVQNTTKDSVYRGTATIGLPQFYGEEGKTLSYLSDYKQEFEVAGNSIKQYYFSVLCPEDRVESVNVELTANGRRFERSIKLYDLWEKDFVIVVSESSGAFRHLAYKKRQQGELDEEDQGRMRQVAVVEPAELPARWHDLTQADLIILDGPPREKLNPAQWDALKTYAQSGGQILITAGRDPSRLKGPLEELAGIKVREMAEVESLDEIYPALSAPRPDWRLPLAEVSAAAEAKAFCDVRYNQKSGQVELCCRHYGSGAVTFLPFSLSDPLLEHWAGRAEIPKSILEANRGRAVFARENQEEEPPAPQVMPYQRFRPQYQASNSEARGSLGNMLNSLDKSFVLETPVKPQAPSTVLAFLLFYLLCAVPGNYLLFGWFKRREVAWLAVPLWTITFCVIAYVIGYMGQTGQLMVNEVVVAEAGPGQTIGVGRAYLCLYAPHRGEYCLLFPSSKQPGGGSFDSQAAPAQLVNREERRNLASPEIFLHDGDAGLSIERLMVQQRSTRQLEVLQRVNLGGGLEARLKPHGQTRDAFDVEIHNATPFPLFNLTLIYEGKAIELTEKQGPANEEVLPAGGSRSLSGVGVNGTPRAWASPDAAFFGKCPAFARFKVHEKNRIGTVNTYLRQRVEKFTEPVLCAWVEKPALPVEAGMIGDKTEEPGQVEGLLLLVMPVPVNTYPFALQPARPYPIRFSTDYNGLAGQGRWQPLAEKTCAPLEGPNKKTKITISRLGPVESAVWLELAVPENHQQLEQEQWQMRLTGCLGVALSKLPKPKPGRTALPPGEIYSGNLQIEAERTDDAGRKIWTEIENTVFQVKLNTPWRMPPKLFSLEDHRLRMDNVIHLRFTITPPNAACPLELQGLKLDAARK